MTKQDDEDVKLWAAVAKTIKRSRPAQAVETLKESPKPSAKKQKPRLTPFEIGQNVPPHSAVLPKYKADSSYQLDGRTNARFTKGKITIDACLDLHDLTVSRAKVAFERFIAQQHKAGARVVLVVTGKGRHIAKDDFNRPRSGVIRESLRDWAQAVPLCDIVLKVAVAQRQHGGAGAYYVYLRRRRGDK